MNAAGHGAVKGRVPAATGSFKIRGALNRLLQLSAAERARGVVAFSSGNHALAIATAAQQLGMPAVIVMPAMLRAPRSTARAGSAPKWSSTTATARIAPPSPRSCSANADWHWRHRTTIAASLPARAPWAVSWRCSCANAACRPRFLHWVAPVADSPVVAPLPLKNCRRHGGVGGGASGLR